MNAKYGINALLIPNSNGTDMFDPLTGEQIANVDPATGQQLAEPVRASQADSIFRNSAYSRAIIFAVLKRNAALPDVTSEADVTTFYLTNPFISNFLSGLNARLAPASDSLKKVANVITDRRSGGLGQTIFGNLANGTADFLIKRAQEEISISVFEKLKKFITQHPEFDTLFPRTCALIKPMEAYDYTKTLEAFKDAIHEDLKNLIPRIALLYDIPRYKLLNEHVPSLTIVFSASSLFGELHGTAGFAESVYKLGEKPFLTEKNNYADFLNILITLSNSLLDKKLVDPEDKIPIYIDKDFIKSVTHNNASLWHDLSQLYLGLIWQHTHNINFTVGATTRNFGQILEHWSSNPRISTALQTINISVNALSEAELELRVLKNNENDASTYTGKSEVRVQRYTIYAMLVSQLLGLSELYIDPANTAFNDRIKEVRNYLSEFTTGIMTMIKDFDQEQYSLGIAKLGEVLKTTSDYIDQMQKDKRLEDMFETELSASLTTQKNSLEAEKTQLNTRLAALPAIGADPLINANIESEKQEIAGSIGEIDLQLKQIAYQQPGAKSAVYKLSKVIEYVNLLAQISKAENSAAVESLLESYALPAGSSRVKKISPFNFAVNAYVGGFFGRSKNQGEGFTNTYGLTAPIGFTLSTGFQKAGSISLFAGLFDIGGIIKYKLDNQGKYQQNISIAGIVSPSVHAVYGFPWFLPFSVGVGCQWISPTTANSNKINLKPNLNAFVGVDIPIFNLKGSKPK
ncbi:MAG TPA: hypothetical protein VK588_15185 [Chitinophagaceae bacterium]|nr:hypothetical protein [Chitinophagaceae bacterium]